MQKARTQDGQVLLASQFKKNSGLRLLCADPACDAEMLHRREGLTHASLTLRDACFVSKDVKAHIPHCAAHEDLKVNATRTLSISKGLQNGHVILINLNMALTDEFNATVRKGSIIGPSTRKVLGPYVAVPAKTIDDLLGYKRTVEEKAGQAGLDRTYVNYKGTVLKIDDFILDSPDKFRAIIDKMFTTLQTDGDKQETKEFPRLMAFKATKTPKDSTQDSKGNILAGTPITLPRAGGKKLVLLQKINAGRKVKQALRGEKVLIIAEPQLLRADAAEALSKLRDSADNVIFLPMTWKITGAHQFTPAGIDAPRQQQSAFKF